MIFVSLAICIACGLIVALPFRDLDSSLPVWFALAPVFWIVARARSRSSAALLAFAFAFTWIMRSLTFLWDQALPGALALSLYTGLIYTVTLLGVRRLSRYGGAAAVFGTAALWALAEIARSVVPVLYFPWLLLGHALLFNAPLRQGADLLGVYGLSFLAAAFNALLAFGLPAWLPERFHAARNMGGKAAWHCTSVLLALIAGFYFYGYERIARIAPRLKSGATIGLIQGNIKTKLGRSMDDLNRQLVRHLELHRKVIDGIKAAEGASPALVCWAETMVPGSMNADLWGEIFQRELKGTGVPALVGSNYLEPEDKDKPPEEQRLHNAAFLFDASGVESMHYCKRRLVAFGEYIPGSRDWGFMRVLRSVTRDAYVPGAECSGIRDVGGYKIALNLCVEDVHPAIAREAAFDGADTLLNLTNDGWFYGTYGPRAHLQAAAWRAIETRRPLLRVTNTGRTAAVDPLGEITLVLEPETEAVGGVKLKRIDDGGAAIVTPYMRLGEFWTAAIFFAALLASLRLRSHKSDTMRL